MSRTKKWLYITFPTNDVFKLDAEVVARDRAEYYVEVDEDTTIQEEVEFALSDEYALIDWLQGNMNWEDVEDEVERVEVDSPDFDEMWLESEVEVKTE
jgi:hypothetical protein